MRLTGTLLASQSSNLVQSTDPIRLWDKWDYYREYRYSWLVPQIMVIVLDTKGNWNENDSVFPWTNVPSDQREPSFRVVCVQKKDCTSSFNRYPYVPVLLFGEVLHTARILVGNRGMCVCEFIMYPRPWLDTYVHRQFLRAGVCSRI